MIDFAAVIERLGPMAVKMQLEEVEKDSRAVDAVKNLSAGAFDERVEEVRRWLGWYRVFWGFNNAKRKAISEAVVRWADAEGAARLDSLDELVGAHERLAKQCCEANGAERDFTSLASKALWLRYPADVPLYDRLASQALSVISKMVGEEPPAKGTPEYYKFACTWRRIYDRYWEAIKGIDMGEYEHRVRIFDKVLWILGEPGHGYSDGA